MSTFEKGPMSKLLPPVTDKLGQDILAALDDATWRDRPMHTSLVRSILTRPPNGYREIKTDRVRRRLYMLCVSGHVEEVPSDYRQQKAWRLTEKKINQTADLS